MIEHAPSASSPNLIAHALRKFSWRILPLIALGYGTAYMDRVNISYAALQMNHDLHFSNTIYGFGAGLYFLSYAACSIPSNLMLYRFGARRWLSYIMVTWGIIAMVMLFVRTPMQFYISRFLLGVAEAGFFPGIVLLYLPVVSSGHACPRRQPLLHRISHQHGSHGFTCRSAYRPTRSSLAMLAGNGFS